MKNPLNRTSIAHDVMNEIKKHDQKKLRFDERRRKILKWLEWYYGFGPGSEKETEELIRRVNEIEKDPKFSEMLLAGLLGFVVSFAGQLMFEGVVTLPEENDWFTAFGEVVAVIIILLWVVSIAFILLFIVRYIAKEHYLLRRYEKLHIAEKEKELIEILLQQRMTEARRANRRKHRVRKTVDRDSVSRIFKP